MDGFETYSVLFVHIHVHVCTGPPERSPPVVRGKTFSQRNVSAAALELQDLRRSQFMPRPLGSELRPNTTASTLRAESGKPLARKVGINCSVCTHY